MTSVERWVEPVQELTTEGIERLYELSKRYAKAEFLKKHYRGKPDNIMAVFLTAHDLRLPPTLTTLNKFHIIEGVPEPHVQVLLGLAATYGHEIWIDHQDMERAVVKGRRAGGDRIDTFEFTMERAVRAGLLDEWWEEWYDSGGGQRKRKWVIKEGETPPAWVTRQGSKAERKKNDYWHSWPEDALANAAARRACRSICPHVLLGLPSAMVDFEPDHETSGGGAQDAAPRAGRGEDAAPTAPAGAPPDDEPEDEDIVDADVVDADVVEDDDQGDPDPEPEQDPPTSRVVDDKWKQTFAMSCSGAGLTDDQRHAILHYATSGRTSTSKELLVSEVPAVREWFVKVTKGDYRFLELDGSVVIAPRSPEAPADDAGQLPLDGGGEAA